MSFAVHPLNAGLIGRFRGALRPRDLFLHDGSNLRRIRLCTRRQLAILAAAVALVGWAAVATIHAFTATPAVQVAAMERKVARMQAEYAAMKRDAMAQAARIEQRQAFLSALVEGTADAKTLASMVPGDLPDAPLSPLTAPYAKVAMQQETLADKAQALAEGRYRNATAALRKLGVDARRFQRNAQLGMGGPYEPVTKASVAESADPQFRQLFLSWKKMDQLEREVISVPSARPLADKNISFTSGFGVRSDPFRGSAAMHAGIDLAGPIGTPVYATADGMVSRAQWASGYGNLVELNHGKGIQTRYGHLSKILVQPGQAVKRGDLIAKMGSTGRSTGSHLHYEVRLDGRAVNPIPFLQSTDYLLAVQTRANKQVALGGPES
ncbi:MULTISPECIES: M23 family metallopeptidase [Sphingomonadales]|uniref:M23 family peptidase n=2 Tax=Edaphosphingomonas TaxID=3423724 RepID=A0A2T4HLH7_9SPHN|nr:MULTISPECIES: M23 family metallopeptidase [Sphingomonas]AGH48967.1 peptidase M23B [Sphingomonas sp. MM-1]MDX3884540.1 M23 family metallopeptidase [Sphingomonas sp.]OHT21384.1 Murein DD-endopeptidase MepM [Sphingomonas haloaromaticamans]PTD16650.1 M23 family peptidase [Sphingomonas fennica]